MRQYFRSSVIVAGLLASALAVAACAGADVTRPCTRELLVYLSPDDTVMFTGQTVTPSVELGSCGGEVRFTDAFTFQSLDPGVVSVDPATNRLTAVAPGETYVTVTGAHYGRLGAIRFLVFR